MGQRIGASRRRLLAAYCCLIMLAAGCGGGSGDGNGVGVLPSTGTPAATVANPAAALDASVVGLQGVTSARSEFDWKVERKAFRIAGHGKLDLRDPTALHLTATYRGQGDIPSSFNEGNDSELLVFGDAIYLKSPPLGPDWTLFTPQEFAADWDTVQALLASRSPIDYARVVAAAGQDVRDLGTGDLDGERRQHLQASVDAGALMNALTNAYGTQGKVMFGNRFAGPVTLDVWLDPVTLLPYRLAASGTFTYIGEPTTLALTVTFVEINGSPDFPAPPADAKPASDLIG